MLAASVGAEPLASPVILFVPIAIGPLIEPPTTGRKLNEPVKPTVFSMATIASFSRSCSSACEGLFIGSVGVGSTGLSTEPG